MSSKSKHSEYLTLFLMQSYALNELLEILKGICSNLNLSYVNPRIKHFKHFQFTFFGLLVKARGLLNIMLFRAEFLKSNNPDFKELHSSLLRLKNSMDSTFNSVNKNNMAAGKKKIIEMTDEYKTIFEKIKTLSDVF